MATVKNNTYNYLPPAQIFKKTLCMYHKNHTQKMMMTMVKCIYFASKITHFKNVYNAIFPCMSSTPNKTFGQDVFSLTVLVKEKKIAENTAARFVPVLFYQPG